jgi:uncharacterized protein GlcG (DUF336 family)
MGRLEIIPLAICVGLGLASTATAQEKGPPAAPPYGPPITLEQAKQVMTAAEAQAAKIVKWPEAIAIVEPSGQLVMFEKADNTQYGSIHLAIRKAETAASFRAPSRIFENLVASGHTVLLGLEGAMPIGGGVPIVVGGKVIGAIGASGAPFSDPDETIAKAGAAALK